MKEIILGLVGGAAVGVGFLLPQLWLLAPFGFGLVLLAVSGTGEVRRAFWLGALAGLPLYGASVGILTWPILPLESWSGLPLLLPLQVVFVGAAWLLAVACFALPFGGAMAVFRYLYTNSSKDLLIAPLVFVFFEWIGFWVFSIVHAGGSWLAGPHFSGASPGYLLASDTALAQFAWLGTIHALNAVLAFFGAFILRLWQAREHERRILLAVVLGAFVMWISGHVILSYFPETSPEALTIAAFSTARPDGVFNVGEDLARDIAERITAMDPKPDVVVLPEGSAFLNTLRGSGDALPASARPLLIADSGSVYEFGPLRGRVEFFNVATGESSYTYKRYFLPFSEYLPVLYKAFLWPFIGGGGLKQLEANHGYEQGDRAGPYKFGDVSLSALMCSESLSPILFREEANAGAQVFLKMASLGWYHDPALPRAHITRMDAVRAIESRRSIVVAMNAGPAFAFDAYGRSLAMSENGRGYITVRVVPHEEVTPSMLLGDVIPFAAGIALLLFAYRKRRHD